MAHPYPLPLTREGLNLARPTKSIGPDPEHEVPERFVRALQATLHERLVAVVLFGSRARGDYRHESDWDLLVIAEELPKDPFERRFQLMRGLPAGLRGAASMLAKTPREFEAHLPSIYLDIALDGSVLFDPAGYAGQRLARLREIIERVGLYRERTPAGDMWQWRDPPTGWWSVEWDS